MQFHVSTDSLAERDRFAAWADAVHTTLGLDAEPSPDTSPAFRANLSGRSHGPLLNLSVAADAHRIAHRGRSIAPSAGGGYRIYREASAGAWFRLPNMEGVTRTGDIVVYDTAVPLETQPRNGFLLEMWVMPKALLEPHLPALGRPLATILSGRSGVEALAASYLDTLTRNWDSIPEAAMAQVADTLGRLIGIACGAAAAEQSDAIRAGRLVEAKRHIDRHLADPNLSPALVASAMGIAVRTLHAAFEPTGTSFARHVQRRRLEECRAALRNDSGRAVTDIAFAWGFQQPVRFLSRLPGGVRHGAGRSAGGGERHAVDLTIALNGTRFCAHMEAAPSAQCVIPDMLAARFDVGLVSRSRQTKKDFRNVAPSPRARRNFAADRRNGARACRAHQQLPERQLPEHERPGRQLSDLQLPDHQLPFQQRPGHQRARHDRGGRC